MGDSTIFNVRFLSEDGRYSVIIEDDGRVSYAYLLDTDGEICGDVWLYNRAPQPVEPEWRDRSKAPFLNPLGYSVSNGQVGPPLSQGEMTVGWFFDGNGVEARVFLREALLAILRDGSRPGWSANAKKDGPLAKSLEHLNV